MTRRLIPLALLALGACDDAMGRRLNTPEGRQLCAAQGGVVFDSPQGDNVRRRCYRMIPIDTTQAVTVERPDTTTTRPR